MAATTIAYAAKAFRLAARQSGVSFASKAFSLQSLNVRLLTSNSSPVPLTTGAACCERVDEPDGEPAGVSDPVKHAMKVPIPVDASASSSSGLTRVCTLYYSLSGPQLCADDPLIVGIHGGWSCPATAPPTASQPPATGR